MLRVQQVTTLEQLLGNTAGDRVGLLAGGRLRTGARLLTARGNLHIVATRRQGKAEGVNTAEHIHVHAAVHMCTVLVCSSRG